MDNPYKMPITHKLAQTGKGDYPDLYTVEDADGKLVSCVALKDEAEWLVKVLNEVKP